MKKSRLTPAQIQSLRISERVLEILARNPDGIGTTEMSHKARIASSTAKSTLARLYQQGKCSRIRRKLKLSSWCYEYLPIQGATIDEPTCNGKPGEKDFVGPPEDAVMLDRPPLLMAWGQHKTSVRLGSYYPMWN